jgi:hypothetical protein
MIVFFVEWGEPVVVKKPIGIATDLNATGQQGVVARGVMNGAGVLKVYLVQSKKYAHHLHFMRAVALKWVLLSLKGLSVNMSIGFKEESQNFSYQLPEMIAEEQSKQLDVPDDFNGEEDYEVEIIGGPEQEQVIMQSVKSAEDVWNNVSVKEELIKEEDILKEETKEEAKKHEKTCKRHKKGCMLQDPKECHDLQLV